MQKSQTVNYLEHIEYTQPHVTSPYTSPYTSSPFTPNITLHLTLHLISLYTQHYLTPHLTPHLPLHPTLHLISLYTSHYLTLHLISLYTPPYTSPHLTPHLTPHLPLHLASPYTPSNVCHLTWVLMVPGRVHRHSHAGSVVVMSQGTPPPKGNDGSQCPRCHGSGPGGYSVCLLPSSQVHPLAPGSTSQLPGPLPGS